MAESPPVTPASEDWDLLLSLFPMGWQEQAILSGALERLRGFRSVENLLRVLLLHVGKGYSLRETAVHAREAGLADVSDVALLKRLRKAEPWWRDLCVALLRESGWHMSGESRGWNVRVVDGTLIKEPGPGGQQWRIHYSLQLPELACDQFLLTPVGGVGTGESLQRFDAVHKDLLLADRGYCRPAGIAKLVRQGAAIVVRLNTSSTPLWQTNGKPFPLQQRLQGLQKPGVKREWKVGIRADGELVWGRLCAIRKSQQAADRARRKILRKASHGPKPKAVTLEYANYVLVFTTLPAAEFSTAEVLRWYRLRWQVELAFKRMKSLAQIGYLPKHDERSSRAWLYGKLLIALLGQKLIRIARDISPWGYAEEDLPTEKSLA
jgi:DDE family transposase